MKTLESLWQTMQTLATKDQQGFYETQVFPLLFAQFAAPGIRNDCAISIHTLGTSTEPVILSAKALNAPRILLLGTTQTLVGAANVQHWLPNKTIHTQEVARAETSSVYAAVNAMLLDVNGPIAIDITGGTKAMVAALAMQAVALQNAGRTVDVYYLENTNWDAALRRPKPGGEELVCLQPPRLNPP